MNNTILRTTHSTALCIIALTGIAVGSARAQNQFPTPPVTPAQPPAVPPASPTVAAPTPPAKPRRAKPFQSVFRPFRIQVGGLFPTSSRTRDDINSAIFHGGLSLDLGATRSKHPVYIGVYLDTDYGQNGTNAPINRLVSVGFGVMARTYFSESTSKTRWYGGVGIGSYTISGKRDVLVDIPATIGDVTVSRLRYRENEATHTEFGGKLFVGAEFNTRFFGEISYSGAGSARGYSPNGPTAAVGIRF